MKKSLALLVAAVCVLGCGSPPLATQPPPPEEPTKVVVRKESTESSYTGSGLTVDAEGTLGVAPVTKIEIKHFLVADDKTIVEVDEETFVRTGVGDSYQGDWK